ncbi:non-ribosomal peptide synthetase, partial [Piscinibacter gummiphilus]
MSVNTRQVAERFLRLPQDKQRSFLDALRQQGIDFGQLPIVAAGAQARDTVSYAQARQWFLWQLDPQSTAYHIAGALTLEGELDVAALRGSFDALVARHESLRTVFEADADGLARQVIREPFGLDIPVIAVDDTAAEAARVVNTPFDLTSGPLLRVAVLQRGAREHVLVVVMHHIVSDGWSMQVIVDEFVAGYRGDAAKLPPMALQYADYAVWQRHWLEAGEKDRQLAYWKAQLGGTQPVLQLPTDHPRRAGGVYRSARHVFELEPALVKALQQRAQAEGATLFMVLLAGLQVVLHRYTGQEDIRIGVPIANRHRAETGGIVGFFVNTQVLRGELDGRTTLQAVLQRAKESALGAQAHQDLPFEQLVEALQPERSLGTTPLFQVLFNHQREDYRALDELPGLKRRPFTLGEQGAQFELTVDTLETANGGVTVSFVHAAELFEAATMDRLADHYRAVLKAMAERPAEALADVPLLGEEERAQLRAWGDNKATHDQTLPVHVLFERQAKRQPDATAVVFEDQSLSYAELNRRANQVAHRLIALGVGPEVKVGIAVERSLEMVVGLLGILKAGGAYVPLDPEYPADRLAYMVADSGITLLLTQPQVRERVHHGGLPVLELDAVHFAAEPGHDPAVPVHGDHLAYVIYTSGSTGLPKGAANRHRSLTSCMTWMQVTFGLDRSDTVLHKAAFGFDVSVWELFWPLTAGARLAVSRPGDHRDPARIVALIRQHGVTTLNFVPSMLQAFLAHEGIEKVTRLRHVIVGGEALPAEAQHEVFRRLGETGFHNLYGPTEAAIHVTHWQCRDDGRSQVPIGRPVSETRAHVLDAALNPVPVGVAGELYLGGVHLGRGYLNRAALTSERFVADPFSEGGRLYRTGDLVRWSAEGQLEYLGRIDQQVKVRGFRIELGEIEAQLLAQPEVQEAVVVADEGRLVAYVTGEVDTSQLRERLGRVLPDYMVPGAMVVLGALPLNPNGKVDRKALPKPEYTSERVYEAPQGEVETRLAAIWAEVLDVARVGRQDNFFELGGHSLLALSLLERMRAAGHEASVRTLFQQPVLGAFAQALAQAPVRREVVVPANGIPADCVSIEPSMVTLVALDEAQVRSIEGMVPGGARNIQDIYPLAPLQEGILFHHLLQSRGDAYVTPCLLSFDSEARLRGFSDRFDQVIARHDILRTAVLWEGLPEPVQVVWRHAALKLEWLPQGGTGSVAERLDAHVDPAHHRIDVRHAPLIRAVAAHDEAQGRWLLQLPSHHLVMDHTTLELLVQEMGEIEAGRGAALPEPVPFRRYVAQAKYGVSVAEHEAFFGRMLGDVEEPTAPFGQLDVQGDGSGVESVHLPLAPALCARVRKQAQQHGVSAASVFHLAWGAVLAKATGQDDVVFGTVLFGRMQGGEGTSRALGLFINTLPLRLRLVGQDVRQALRQTHEGLSGLMQHEHASLTLAQRCSGLPGGTPLFTALLNYRYSGQGPVEAGVWEGMEVLGGEERTNYPVGMSVDDLGDGFVLTGQVSARVGAQRLCGLMARAVESLVQALAERPGARVTELAVLGAEEREQLRAWGDNKATHDQTLPVHVLFERQAKRQPDEIAVVFEEESLSYAELNRRANQVAHRLIALGVGPEVKVGIAVERSLEMVVGLLGILKAGGAYVPLDPEYPADRLAYMVADSGITLLLTQPQVRERVRHGGLPVLELDAVHFAAEPGHDPAVPVHGDHLAYVIYTSGSTGLPKGAANRHRSLTSCMTWMQVTFGLDRSDTVLHKAAFGFDVSVWELFWPLTAGARLAVSRPGDHRDPARIVALIRQHGVTTLNFVPSMLQAFLAHEGIEKVTRLRHVIVGGEALPAEAQHEVFRRLGETGFHNLYGPTEAAIHVTHWQCRDDGRSQVPIGRPVSETRAHVLDAALNPVPVGVAGELYLGGVHLGRGYLNRAALTSERFVADPFSEGGRLYRTGDLVRWSAEGQLEYLGRIDQQVKVRGFRVELGEIEAQLLAQPEVQEAVVVADEGRLVAYVTGEVDTSQLRERLGRVLPDYMVPGAMVVLGALPLNPNEKVDRKALPKPEYTSERVYEAPQGEVETRLAAIWAEVLG